MKIVFKVCLILILISCKSNTEENNQNGKEYTSSDTSPNENKTHQSESYQRGKEVYNDFCITCHLGNGKGIPGSFPPLDDSNWLTEKRTESISAVKHGLKGPITVNGKEYNSMMVDLGLTNKEVADVMNYINNSWSNNVKKPVTEEEVAAVKK